MSTNTNWTANPSRISLPTYGHALGTCAQVDTRVSGGDARSIAVCVRPTPAVMSRTKGAFPGNSAWRPPIC